MVTWKQRRLNFLQGEMATCIYLGENSSIDCVVLNEAQNLKYHQSHLNLKRTC